MAQTLDKDDKPIPRLYSAGELGSFFGLIYPGGSNIAEAIAFGSIAGENAAAEKPWTS
jgi:succinate dehydrogenase/fumarate reductase flavoprotein subunit